MKIKIFLTICLISILSVGIFSAVLAAGPTGGADDTAASNGSQDGVVSLPNPLGDSDDLKNPQYIVGNIIRAILGIVGSLALLMFIYGGFLWVTSAGNDEKIKKGKDIIVWSSVGLAVIFFSYIMVTFVVTALTGGSGANPVAGA